MNDERAFTLLELLVGITVMTIIAATVYASLRLGLASYRSMEEAGYARQNTRNALFLVSRDVRCAYAMPGCFNGSADGGNSRVSLVACLPAAGADSGALAVVEYRMAGDSFAGHTGLVRIDRGFPAGPAEKRAARVQDIAPLATAFSVRYFDGKNWYDEWDGTLAERKNTLPVAVEIAAVIAHEGKDNAPERVSTVVPVYAGTHADQ